METIDKRIVVVEDNPYSLRLARKLLVGAGYEVYGAEDGETGYDLVVEHKPTLVLIDLGLPDIDGQTVVAMLRQQDDVKDTPIIAFTAYPTATAQEMAKAYGCDGVITKPIDTRSFIQQLESFLEKPSASGG